LTLTGRGSVHTLRGMFSRMLPALVAALILPAAAQAAGPWYVSKSGNNANTCLDTAHACLTIGAAVTKASSGDTVNIGPGTFNEAVNAAGKFLIFNGAGSDATTGTVVDGHGAGSAFILSNGGELHDLRATEDSAATISVGAGGGSQKLIVTNAVILADGFQSAIDAETAGGSLAVTISDSTLQQVQTSSGGAEYGLLMEGSIGASLTRVTASSVQSDAVAGSLGVNISATDSTFTGTTGLADNNATLHVYRCRITGTVDEGIYVSAVGGAGSDMSTIVEDSLVQGVTTALNAHANSLGKASTATLHDSTLVASGPGTVDGAFTDAFNNATSSIALDGSVVRAQSTNGGATRDLHADQAAATINASFSAFTTAVGTSSGTVPAPASGSNISGDPLFTNPAGGDYTLQQSSPLIDNGDQAGLAAGEKDVTGGARVLDGNGDGTAIVDIGAFEHTYVPPAGGTTPPPGGGTTTPPPATDTTAPAFTNVKVRNGKLRFTLSEAAKVTVTITKGKKHKRVRRFTIAGKAGTNSAVFKKLKAGKYRIALSALDSSGNRSKLFSRAFRVKRHT
jgi:hypothetical protein